MVYKKIIQLCKGQGVVCSEQMSVTQTFVCMSVYRQYLDATQFHKPLRKNPQTYWQ